MARLRRDRPRRVSLLSGSGLNWSRQVLALVRYGDEGISWDMALKFRAFHTPHRLPGLKLGICRSDKTLALRYRETLNYKPFPWPGRIPDQVGDDVSGWREACLKSNGVSRRQDTWFNETEAAVHCRPGFSQTGEDPGSKIRLSGGPSSGNAMGCVGRARFGVWGLGFA